MRDIAALMDAIWEAYNLAIPIGDARGRRNKFEPFFSSSESRWYTKCNEGFNLIACRMGYDKFDRRETQNPTDAQLANAIYLRMVDADGDWRQIDAVMAQQMANAGCLVAAIDRNNDRPGHVCVVVPGNVEHSPSFNGVVPKVMNIGKDVFIGKRASFAFSAEDKPLYFCLKEDFVAPTGAA